MSVAHAQSFVEKFFEDDEFLKQVISLRGFSKYENSNENSENEKMVVVANKMGFIFNSEEYMQANKEYANNLGGWETMKKVFHAIKIASYISKEK